MAYDLTVWPGLAGMGLRLTRQEHDILAASARGASVSQVASALGPSEQEVRRALVSAMGKLGAHSKLEAVVTALRHGLIALDA